MISFQNDYNNLAHPKIMEDLTKIQEEINLPYGTDIHSTNAKTLIQKAIGRDDLDIHFIHGGTMINIIAIKSVLKAYQGVISCNTGHILGHENGAIEASGHQIIQAEHVNGKLTVNNLIKVFKQQDNEYSVEPKLVYISNATELGTVYTKSELSELSETCKSLGLYLYIDGARLATAIESSISNLSLTDIAEYADIFTIGGTKNGMLFGEALVIKNTDFSEGIRKLIKQKGGMLAKGFAIGAQFETMFKDGLYFDLAKNAIKSAEKLSQTFQSNGINLFTPQESNLVFPILSNKLLTHLEKDFLFETMEEIDSAHTLTRFVTRYSTTEEEINALDVAIKAGLE